jgi:glycosyltransferase involved in cell wall biosynthesis
MARLLIAAMESSGHRARLVRWVMESDVMSKAEVILSGPGSLLEHKELVALRGRFVPQEVFIDQATATALANSSLAGLVRKQTIYRTLYSRAVRQAKLGGAVDLVILPAADDALDAWAVLGTGFAATPWVGISMRPVFHLGSMRDVVAPSRRDDWVRNKLYRRVLRDRGLHKLLTFDPTMMDFALLSFRGKERERLAYLPDPSLEYDLPARGASRAELGIPDEAHLVLLYGSLTARKGVSQLIRAASVPQCPISIHILLAGRQNGEVKQFLQQIEAKALSVSGRLHVLEQYLDDRLERTVLSAADSMWLGYSKFYGMSGVLVLAVRHGLPCIFTREGVIGYLGRKFAVGPEIDPDNIQTVVQALRSLTMKPEQYRRSLAEARQRFAVHSIENFRSVISETVISAIPS